MPGENRQHVSPSCQLACMHVLMATNPDACSRGTDVLVDNVLYMFLSLACHA